MCGVGGDLLAMVWAGGALAGLNSSGRLPAAAALPPEGVPERGIGSATVPGAPAGWRALAERFGTRPLRTLAAPAIRLAREGVARAPGLARMTEWSREVLARDVEAARIFLADGPLVQPDLARTLEEIEGFYEGPVARRAPAPFTPADFAAHRAEWVEPRRAPFAGVAVCELAPAMALRSGHPRLVFGTMGGEAQVQIHLQLLARILVAGEPPERTIAAPRWTFTAAMLLVEAGLPRLAPPGLEVTPMPVADLAGHAHAILVEDGGLRAACDPRADGVAVGEKVSAQGGGEDLSERVRPVLHGAVLLVVPLQSYEETQRSSVSVGLTAITL